MNTKSLVLKALLVSVGAALYLIIPGINGGMKPDFMLTMMFVGILLFPNAKSVFLLAVTTGVISGLFSTFPAGFIPNIVDKFITAFVFFAVVVLIRKLATKLPVAIALCGLGTILSGAIFLSVAIFILNVDVPFGFLFLTVVLPAVLMNGVAFAFIFPIVTSLVKRAKLQTAVSESV
ncbi:tryptophan transporter [Planococcus sp. N028]|uniref:Tryptophan transporter n=1 Tax=Planococcus shixiaomingii TaxID=3058393 RepID=A0ABT8N6E3_9BACL|nr:MULTISPECIES: tryptophan transporter [unclassified Planococcus (in: firmicutes)]MDN7243462.1 tryptophan transporter [Planococcus sp. N028]WKA55907.1 tryptophan transporter [Planococcus sp. N022]